MTSIRHHDAVRGTLLLAPRHRLPSPPATTYSNGIDWVAVERAARGELRADALTPAESREAAIWLVRAGVSRKAISIRLSVYERLVKEWAAAEGLLPDSDLCTTSDCRRAASGRGLCTLHLQRLQVLDREWRAAVSELAVAA